MVTGRKKEDGEEALEKSATVTAANKEWHNERMRKGTIGEDTLIQWIQRSSLLSLSEFASSCEVMEM